MGEDVVAGFARLVLDFACLLDGQVSGFLAFENATHIRAAG